MNNKPILPWMGGKRLLLKHIFPLPEHNCYVEPFCGGAALFFAKEPSKVEIINDINGDLINLYRVVKHHLEEFLRHFKYALISRSEYLMQQKINPDTLTDIQRAARFFYLQKLAFGGKTTGQNFGTAASSPPRLNLLRIEEDLSTAHLRLARTTIEHLPWDNVIKRYDRDYSLFYLDPPYWGTTGYGMPFEFDNYLKMATLAKTIAGKMIISVNDIPEMREVFNGLNIKTIPHRYTVGGSKKDNKKINELIIRNF
jgi:DNA adenine methylase